VFAVRSVGSKTREAKTMAARGESTTVTVEGHTLTLTNLDKVMYPRTGTTKGDVLAYYAAIAPVLIRHAHDRPATPTRRRSPTHPTMYRWRPTEANGTRARRRSRFRMPPRRGPDPAHRTATGS
jgi:hypothetical protein